MLVTRERVATLLVSPSPFTDDGRRRHRARSPASCGFTLRVSPVGAGGGRAARRASRRATSRRARLRPRADPYFDFTAANRPPAVLLQHAEAARRPVPPGDRRARGVVERQPARDQDAARAGGVAAVLVAAIIGWPLVQAGRPAAVPAGVFRAALGLFRDHRARRSCSFRSRSCSGSRSISAIRRTRFRSSCS